MRTSIYVLFLCLCLITGFAGSPLLLAQELTPFQRAQLQHYLAIENHLTAEQRQLLSTSVRDSIKFAHELLDPPDGPGDDDGNLLLDLHSPGGISANSSGLNRSSSMFSVPGTSVNRGALLPLGQRGLVKISQPELELQFSRLGGFSDIQSSTARCGENVVTAYRSGIAPTLSELLPFLANPNLFPAQSLLGVAYSTNGGQTFTALPFLHAGPAVDFTQPGVILELGGNASVGCSTSGRFYVVNSPFNPNQITFPNGFEVDVLSFGAGISISEDGGQTWADPVPVVLKNQNHTIDSAFLATDPQHPNRLYVSYLDIDFSFFDPLVLPLDEPQLCPDTFMRIASEVVSSVDGGRTWSHPAVIREDCLPQQPSGAQGFHPASTRLAIGADGKVNAAYLLMVPVFGSDGTTVVDYHLEVHVRQSSNGARSFGHDVKVSDLVQIGAGDHSLRSTLQGFFAPADIPVIAVDPVSHGKSQNLYIAWADGRDNPQPDLAAPFGTYNYGDIVLSRSTDGGMTWSPPGAVSPTPAGFKGAGRDQFLPSIAVNARGTVALCYYDRRNDPANNAFDRYCSISENQARTFHDVRQSSKTWTFGQSWDRLGSWLGDYDTIAPPSIQDNSADFFGSFGISGDDVTGIFGRSIQREQ